jgi:uncharacterized membrane protein YjjP (DUF1212 family)
MPESDDAATQARQTLELALRVGDVLLTATYYAAPTTVPMTLIRTVQPDVLDFSRVRRVQALVERIRAGLPLGDAIKDLARIRDAPRLYSG